MCSATMGAIYSKDFAITITNLKSVILQFIIIHSIISIIALLYYIFCYIFQRHKIFIHTTNTFNEWYNFLFINKYSLSTSGGKMAICVPSIAPITPGKPPFWKNLKKS